MRTGLLRSVVLLLSGVAVLSLPACLSRPALHRETFAIEGPGEIRPGGAAGPFLILQHVTVSPLFQGPNFVYRTGRHEFERDPYASFLVAPEEMLRYAVEDYLRNLGLFSWVGSTPGGRDGALYGRIRILDLAGDFTVPPSPKATLELQCSLFADRDLTKPPLLDKVYHTSVPIPERRASAVAEGWNEALRQIMEELGKDLVVIVEKRGQ